MVLVKGQEIHDRQEIQPLQIFYLSLKNCLGAGSYIYRARFEHENEIAAGFKVAGAVSGGNLGLTALSYVLIDQVYRLDKKCILFRPGCIGEDGHNVFAPLAKPD
jgi:hypothetical protein